MVVRTSFIALCCQIRGGGDKRENYYMQLWNKTINSVGWQHTRVGNNKTNKIQAVCGGGGGKEVELNNFYKKKLVLYTVSNLGLPSPKTKLTLDKSSKTIDILPVFFRRWILENYRYFTGLFRTIGKCMLKSGVQYHPWESKLAYIIYSYISMEWEP